MSYDDDNPSAITLKVEPLALHNIGGEQLAKQFAAELARVHAAFTEEGEPYEGRRVKAKLTVSVDLELDQHTGQTSLKASVRSTLPKRKTLSRPVMLRAGGFLLEEDDEQLVLYDNTPKRSFTE